MKKIVLLLCFALLTAVLSACSPDLEPFVKKNYGAEPGEILGITVDVRDRQLEVQPSEDGSLSIDYSESGKEFYEISVSAGGMLTMKSSYNKGWQDYIGSKPSAADRIITLHIPDALLTSLKLTTTNEEIKLAPLSVSGDVFLSSNGGNIGFEALDAGSSITIECKDGDISGSVSGAYEEFAVTSEIKKGESNLPTAKDGEIKELNVRNNNGNIKIDFTGTK